MTDAELSVVSVGVGVREISVKVAVTSGVSVISGMIISNVELIAITTLIDEVADGSIATCVVDGTGTDVLPICPLTSNAIISNPMHCFHCLFILQ